MKIFVRLAIIAILSFSSFVSFEVFAPNNSIELAKNTSKRLSEKKHVRKKMVHQSFSAKNLLKIGLVGAAVVSLPLGLWAFFDYCGISLSSLFLLPAAVIYGIASFFMVYPTLLFFTEAAFFVGGSYMLLQPFFDDSAKELSLIMQ